MAERDLWVGRCHVKARHPDARQILDNPHTASWRKRELLAAWLPHGRVRHALLSAEGDAASLDNYRPIADEGRP